jgi:hypothetical protein
MRFELRHTLLTCFSYRMFTLAQLNTMVKIYLTIPPLSATVKLRDRLAVILGMGQKSPRFGLQLRPGSATIKGGEAGVGVEPIVREMQAHVPNHLGLALRPYCS